MLDETLRRSLRNTGFPVTAKKPAWIRARLPSGEVYRDVDRIIRSRSLHTVCESAKCPNLGECWGRGTATFMILGDICTRACGFCAVKTGRPLGVDKEEPSRVALAVKQMGLKFVVITSVDRDDLPDGGAENWAETIRAVRRENPNAGIEALIPDFNGDPDALRIVLDAEPDILAHNLETVPRLYRIVRARSIYERSLVLLRRAADAGFRTKTGIMLGIGEEINEVEPVLADAVEHGVKFFTVGQYLRPSPSHLPVQRWVTPDEFRHWKEVGESLGLEHVESGPMVRSSYHAEEQVIYHKASNTRRTQSRVQIF